MEWTNLFRLLAAVFASVGGAGVILLGLSSWLGKVWANRILEKDKLKYQSELDKLKMSYELEAEKLKSVFLRYSESQFHLYNNLWASLCDLKSIADDLWEEASEPNVRKFARQLKQTKQSLEKSFLFIEDEHYGSLIRIMREFGEYRVGKIKLIELWKENVGRLTGGAINATICSNMRHKLEFTEVLDRIRASFKHQIRGGAFS